MESYSRKKWEDLDLSRDEINSIGEALKKEEFRTLLLDYVKEINDPENRKQYENEITQLENERGVDVSFIHPDSGYVIKTIVNGDKKAFINICTNENIAKPTSQPSTDNGQKGLCWSLPHCLAPPREDVDKKNIICSVYDVVFHPDTLHMTKSNSAFKKLVDDIALDAIEKNFHVSLDKINIKYPKIQFKGMKQATVIRKPIPNFIPTDQPSMSVSDIPNYPYPPLKEDHGCSKENHPISKEPCKISHSTSHTTPNHIIRYRNNLDLQNFTNDPMSKMSLTIPNELVITIDLPLLKRSTDASLDVLEKSLTLISEMPAKYKLKLDLPYVVDSNKGNAKFDIVKKTLTVTLPVVQPRQTVSTKIDSSKDDSGIESDSVNNEKNTINSGSSSDEDFTEKGSPAGLVQSKENKVKHFLKPEVHYSLPPLKCSAPAVDNILNITASVPNVEPDSVEYINVKNATFSGFHMSFLSTGNGFFTQNYAVCFLLPLGREIKPETLKVEVYDAEVQIQAQLVQYNDVCDIPTTFYVGVEESSLNKMEFFDENDSSSNVQGPGQVLGTSICSTFSDKAPKKEEISLNLEENGSIQGDSNSQMKEQHIGIKNLHSSGDSIKRKQFQEDKKHSSLALSESGSSFDDESSSSPPRQASKPRTVSESQHEKKIIKSRGILKIGRSLSESSADDYASWSCDKAEKTKKTVRFNEVNSVQTFRMNSSILGQRKKNQRKMRNKKRAQERRLSESGNESECENEVFRLNQKGSDGWSEDGETDQSSCDVSEVSDVSESDDGQPKECLTFMPNSSRKNHRRRGKKSARKNAATAKHQFFEN